MSASVVPELVARACFALEAALYRAHLRGQEITPEDMRPIANSYGIEALQIAMRVSRAMYEEDSAQRAWEAIDKAQGGPR